MAATLQFRSGVKETTSSEPSGRPFRVELLDQDRHGGAYGTTFVISMLAHAALIVAVVLVPLLFLADEVVPPTDAVRAFFAAPAVVTPPPPPPPPPAAGPVAPRRALAPAATPPPADSTFRAPVEIPDELPKEAVIDLGTGFGVEGGVEGGIEGGVVGGIVGGVVGGTGVAAATPPPVRIGGNIKAPKMIRRVAPVYPQLAAHAHIQGVVILEARVDDHGAVTDVRVLRSAALLDEAALEAVRQWRYQPLLLNGQPTGFVMVVTVAFNLNQAPAVGTP
jgi:protein TonB